MDTSRREFVRIASIAMVGACAGCLPPPSKGGQDTGKTGTTDTAAGDTEVAADTEVPTNTVPAGWTALPLSSNPKLANVGGFLYKTLGGARLIVAKIDNTPTYVALSSVCTHAGCDVTYQQGNDRFYCGCHGSAFADDGTVTHGPAGRALKQYETQWDAANEQVLVHKA